jgi:diguanylate cyclase (GGDEF)-like protein/PAS domain S-box-containing protein
VSERLLEDFAQIASDWFWEMDADLRFTYFSERAAEFGIAPELMLGRGRMEVAVNRQEAPFWEPHLDDLRARRPFRDFTYPFLHPDGRLRWIKTTGQPRFSETGVFLGYRGVGSDVTAERNTQEQLALALVELRETNGRLEQQNRRFDSALGHMSHGLTMFDRQERLIVCNARYIEMYGMSPEVVKPGITLRELIEHRIAVGSYAWNADAEKALADFRALTASRTALAYSRILGDGRVIAVSHKPMMDGGFVATHEDITHRELHHAALIQQEEKLRTQNLRFDAALNNMPQGLVMLDREMRLIVCNSRYLEIMGLSPAVVKPGATLREIVEHGAAMGLHPTETAESVLAARMALFARGEPAVLTIALSNSRTIQTAYRPMADGGWVATYEDVTERELHLDLLRRQEEELRTQNMRFDSALSNMSHGLCMFDRERRLIVCNRRYAEMYGLPPQLTRPGVSYDQLLQHRLASGVYPKSGAADYVAGLSAAIDEARPMTTLVELKDDRVLSITFQPMPHGGWVAIHEDVTERKRAELRIEHMARHDALTDLANRTLFREKTEAAIARVRRRGAVAVLCLDLDHFKAVNDTLGHPAGDALLCAVTDRLRDCVRDIDTVARLGGDEFAILQLGIERPEEAGALARRVIEALSRPYDIEGQQVVIGASIGIAIYPGDGCDSDQLLKHADLALYRAKGDGRGTFRFFEPEMDARLRARRALELDLRKALAEEEFELFYQPLFNLRSDQVSGCEALVRWNHPTRGLVSPADFIGLAEEVGLIVPLGEWVLRRACMEAAQWPRDIKVAVNLSPASSRAATWCRRSFGRSPRPGSRRPGSSWKSRRACCCSRTRRRSPPCISCAPSGCGSRWMTSGPAIPR